MPAYNIPKANVPPPLTVYECDSFKSKVSKELKFANQDCSRRSASLPNLHKQNNNYHSFFKDERHKVSEEHVFTYDQVKDATAFDPKAPKETFHSNHTVAARQRCSRPLRTRWMVRSSQAYGWLPPIDDPKLGFGRSSIFFSDAMDSSHVCHGVAAQAGQQATGAL
uniref:Uncharacterized protein n=1 Tax=Alexandrium catenella TaxID=2925 RepID=A0A7S1QDP1_ALECA|eukprot:CAMPEP_0171214730 /NCGR_PEP_ID=MMETSP0790-20130122/31309_1 /TAXON_ID=2925 /ORGANISM="Alexandrium catenella, Strain OF101" /LENGTH=165 /DNA_ID=CAMNT_0011680475 /DNA_START=47 /DNA_END=544 /DNA_ORIENTATION=+